MSIETAVFAVQRGASQFKCKGSDLSAKVLSGDLFAVQRGDTYCKGTSDQVQDTDLLACTDTNGVTYKVTGAQFNALFGPPWKGAEAIYHVIVTDPSGCKPLNKDKIYNLATETEVSSITAAGEWIITGKRTVFKQSPGNWEFGDLTNTSIVTNMVEMFFNAKAFNSDLSKFDVGNVQNMEYMFRNANAFNQDLTSWDVGNVTDMSFMFNNAYAFNGDISGWDVSNAKKMRYMFFNTNVFNQDLSKWNVGNVENMYFMFEYAVSFNSDISKWDVSNATDMYFMFNNAHVFNQDLGNWDVSKVTNMKGMFNNAYVFNQDLSNWCVNPEPNHADFRDNSAMPLDWSHDPKWGTCP